jgi:hypothetical protein
MKLDVMRLGLAIGIVWGAGVLLLGLMAAVWGWGATLVQVFGSLYLGFAPTFAGSLLGAAWGFADGFIGGALIAWLYNILPGPRMSGAES